MKSSNVHHVVARAVAMAHTYRILLLLLSIPLSICGCGNDPNPNIQPGNAATHLVLSVEVKTSISQLVRAGFDSEAQMREIICEEIYAKERLNPKAVDRAIKNEEAQLQKEKESWPKVTDCDKLFQTFEVLNQKGVIALHRAGLTQSDGYEIFKEERIKRPRAKQVEGYCFYTGQDLDGALSKRGLYLAFGPSSTKNESIDGAKVGRIIVEELNQAGLKVQWDGSFNSRIHLPEFDWKRR